MRVWSAQIYMRNQEVGELVLVTEEVILDGTVFIECPECGGTGVFEIAETDSQPCNHCKTSGLIPVSC